MAETGAGVDVEALRAAYERGAASITLQSVQAQEDAGIRAVLATLAAECDAETVAMRAMGKLPISTPIDKIVRICGEAVAVHLQAQHALVLDSAQRTIAEWEATGEAIMAAIGQPGRPLSDAEVIGALEQVRTERDRLRQQVAEAAVRERDLIDRYEARIKRDHEEIAELQQQVQASREGMEIRDER